MARGESLRLHSRRRWSRLRAAVLREEPLCRGCRARGLVVLATEVDHIVRIEDGGTDAWHNLQALCHTCHATKTALERGYRPACKVGIDGVPEGWQDD